MTDRTTDARGWCGRLELGFSARAGRTEVSRHRFSGPLRIQRTFHPEPTGVCHAYVLHPPGGVVGGDRLELQLEVDAGAHALLTTPGATKLYRSLGARSLVRTAARVANGGMLEWLPQGTIAFDQARAALELSVAVEPGGTFIGWELTALGRPAGALPFEAGSVTQRVELFQGEDALLFERLRLGDGSPVGSAAWGLGGHTVFGTLYVVGAVAARVVERVAAIAPLRSQVSGTHLGGVSVFRCFGDSLHTAQQQLTQVWALARSACGLSGAEPPRVWAT